MYCMLTEEDAEFLDLVSLRPATDEFLDENEAEVVAACGKKTQCSCFVNQLFFDVTGRVTIIQTLPQVRGYFLRST